MNNEPETIKICIIGDSNSGKTALLDRYINKTYKDPYSLTVGVDYMTDIYSLGNKKIRSQIYDFSGIDKFRDVIISYIKKINGFILSYDISNRISFERLDYWYGLIKQYAPNNPQFLLVGNKLDLDYIRKVSSIEGHKKAQDFNAPFIEVSAKDDLNINVAFETLIKTVYSEKL